MSGALIERLRERTYRKWSSDVQAVEDFEDELATEAADRIEALEREVAELEAERDSAREYGKEARIRENKAENARIHEQMLRQAAEADKARLSEARRLVDGIDEERRGALDLCVERNKEIARLSAKLAEARAANERDRTEVCMAVNSLSDAFARRDWLMRGGRGSYEWDDDRFRDEFRDAMAEFEPHIDRLRKIGADRANCPETQAEVRAARAALSGSGSGWRAMDTAPETGFFLAWSPDFPDMVSCWKAEIFHQARKPGTPRHLSANHFTLWRPLDLPAAPQQGGE